MDQLAPQKTERKPGDAIRREAMNALRSGDYELAQALSAAATALQRDQAREVRA